MTVLAFLTLPNVFLVFLMLLIIYKGSIGHAFTVCIRTENQNQAGIYFCIAYFLDNASSKGIFCDMIVFTVTPKPFQIFNGTLHKCKAT